MMMKETFVFLHEYGQVNLAAPIKERKEKYYYYGKFAFQHSSDADAVVL